MGDTMDESNKMHKIFYIFCYLSVTATVFVFAFMLLRFPDYAGQGVKKGIDLCVYTLIPSMYPFMFLSSFIVSSGLSQKSERLFSFFTEKVFKLPGVCGSAILLSMIGGLPVGGRMTGEMYDKGYITKEQGQRLLMFCINPGPAFVITSVGYYMLGSKNAGIILFVSLVLSSLTVGLLTRFAFPADEVFIKKSRKESQSDFQSSVVSSVTESGRGMLTVCAWVILFSCIGELVDLFPLSDGMKIFVNSILEMTTGCERAASFQPMPIIAGIIGFSGICAHMQIMPSVMKVRLKLKYFILGRIINSALAIIYSMALFELFPITVETISMGSLPQRVNRGISLPVCVGVMLMCILLLLGENFRIRKNFRNKI